jgi:hypothetical protein
MTTVTVLMVMAMRAPMQCRGVLIMALRPLR